MCSCSYASLRFWIFLGTLLVTGKLIAQNGDSSSSGSGGGLAGGSGVGSYPQLFSSQASAGLQATTSYSPVVPTAQLGVQPPSPEGARAVPLTDSDASFGWHANKILSSQMSESTYPAKNPIYTSPSIGRLELRSGSTDAEGGTTEQGGDGLLSTTDGMNGSMPNPAALGMAPEQAAFATSCLDSPSGCGGLAFPNMISVPVLAPRARVRNAGVATTKPALRRMNKGQSHVSSKQEGSQSSSSETKVRRKS